MRFRFIIRVIMGMTLVAALAHPAGATSSRAIVRIRADLDGWGAITSVCNLVGCQVVRTLDTLPGETAPSSLFLVQGLSTTTVTPLLGMLGVEAIELDLPVAVMTDSWGAAQASAAVLDQLWNRTPVSYYGTTAWEAYLVQPAGDIVRVRETHCALHQTGGGVVAVIDTGVDPDHPTLAPVLTGGYDFTRDVAGGNEKADVDQASASVLDGIYCVNPRTAASLDQASASVLDDGGHDDFGHGTMVAGVVHLVAPAAQIMPLKAFGPNGQGNTSDSLRSILYAVRNGAKVINMSFSRATPSNELRRALDYATAHGVIAVASAGNDGQDTLVYPAAYDNVMGVASTADDDTRSSFSNYGSGLVWVAAPGEGVITTYPWGSFAAAWGTSFSTPFVAGAAALLAGMQPAASYGQASSAVSNAAPLDPALGLGYGRLDLFATVQAGLSMWPSAPERPVPDSCAGSATDWSENP